MVVPVLQVTASVVIALFLLRVLQRALAQTSNQLATSVEGALGFLLGP